MSNILAKVQAAQVRAGEDAVTAHLEQRLAGAAPTSTFVDDDGVERRDRRRKDRSNEDPRIDQLFNGFDNSIDSAKLNGDEYRAGYLKAMRAEFGQLIASLDR